MRVVSGRWGAVDVAEAFFLARGRGYLQDVLLAVLSKRTKAAKPDEQQCAEEPPSKKRRKTQVEKPSAGDDKKRDDAAALMDDDSEETYRLQLSTWASGAFAAARCSVFWLFIRLEHEVRSPLSYFFCWTQKHVNDEMLLKLVTHQANAIMQIFDKLDKTFDQWFANAVQEMKATDLPQDLLGVIKSFALKQLVTASGNFHLRVVSVTLKDHGCNQPARYRAHVGCFLDVIRCSWGLGVEDWNDSSGLPVSRAAILHAAQTTPNPKT